MRRFILHLTVAALALPVLTHGQAPAPSEFMLPNGLRVRLVPVHDEHRVTTILAVRAGFFEEPRDVPHIAHVTEHLTVFDVKHPPSREAVNRWYKQGGANGETMGDVMYLDLHVTAAELSEALKVQAERLGAMEFSRETLARELPRTLQEIEFLERSPHGGTGKFALAAFVQAAFHGANDVPIKARTQRITIDEVKAFHARTFRPDRATLIVVGSFDQAKARQEIEQLFGEIKKPEARISQRPPLKSGTLKVKWDVPTRHLLIAWPMPPAEKPAHAALTLAGQHLMQRLFVDAELKPLVKMPLVQTDVAGVFLINLQLQDDADAGSSKSNVMEAVRRLTLQTGVSDFDVLQGRRMLGQLTQPPKLDGVRLPPNVTKTMAHANVELQRTSRELVWGDLAAYLQRVEKLTAEDVRLAVSRHLPAEKATIVHLEPR